MTSPNLISSATSAGAAPSPLPSLALLLALVAIARQSTRCPTGGKSRNPRVGNGKIGAAGANRTLAIAVAAGAGLAFAQRRGRFLEAVVAPEDLVADGHARDAADPAVVGLLGGLLQAVLGGLELDRP